MKAKRCVITPDVERREVLVTAYAQDGAVVDLVLGADTARLFGESLRDVAEQVERYGTEAKG